MNVWVSQLWEQGLEEYMLSTYLLNKLITVIAGKINKQLNMKITYA